jgi:hypothetical protein
MTQRGFVGVELAIAIAIIAVLGIGAVASYSTYHARMESSDSSVTSSSTMGGWVSPPATSTSSTDNRDTGDTAIVPVENHTATITDYGSGQVVHMHVDDHIVLQLGTNLAWSNLSISNPQVLANMHAPLSSGEQGLFRAVAKGTTHLTMNGTPVCAPHVACPDFGVLFDLTVVVE